MYKSRWYSLCSKCYRAAQRAGQDTLTGTILVVGAGGCGAASFRFFANRSEAEQELSRYDLTPDLVGTVAVPKFVNQRLFGIGPVPGISEVLHDSGRRPKDGPLTTQQRKAEEEYWGEVR